MNVYHLLLIALACVHVTDITVTRATGTHILLLWIANTKCLLFPGTTRNQWVTRWSRTPGTSGEYLSDLPIYASWHPHEFHLLVQNEIIR